MASFFTVVVALVCTPFVVYISAKLWAYGTLVGIRKFYQDHPETPDLRTR